MILPPPNVTGVLHVGHALTVALQDSLARWHRMRGDRVLWVPGLDHAGIATQSVVEKRLAATSGGSITRHDLGREEFLKQVWEWREEHGRRIIEQLQGLGASLDWEHEFFTLDEMRSRAVTEAFVRLHEAGLVYRRERHVNWCCALRTTISDIEVDRTSLRQGGERLGPIPGHDPNSTFEFGVMSRFAYPVIDENGHETGEELVVATTRLETMLGDVAVAVHPDDVRYQHLHGKRVLHPLRHDVNPWRTMPIVTDRLLVDPNLGTGAVKITPAHDPEDYACAERVLSRRRRRRNTSTKAASKEEEGEEGREESQLLPLNWEVFDESGEIVESCSTADGQIFVGMPRYEARETVEVILREHGLWREETVSADEELGMDGEETVRKKQGEAEADDSVTILPRCSRSGDVVEPRLLPQWYVRTTDPSLSGVASKMGASVIDGDRHVNEWSRWLDGNDGDDHDNDGNKQDWCVSRQLWWGHRVPAWKITNLQYETEKDLQVVDVVQDGSWLRRLLLPGEESSSTSIGSSDHDKFNNKNDNDTQWIVARTKEDAEKIALEKIWQETKNLNVPISWYFDLEQDEDVLDTWFSSAILPLSSFGWPQALSKNDENEQLLSDFYPLSVMETGSDILFFWVARMAMLCSFLDSNGSHSTSASTGAAAATPPRAPFERVLLHPMVRDKRGRKMSKSLGNVIDPLDITRGATLDSLMATLNENTNMSEKERAKSLKDLQKEYPGGIPQCGVDGLRFALCSYLEGPDMSSTINLNVQRAVSARHMCNKLWNAAKFILSSSNAVGLKQTGTSNTLVTAIHQENLSLMDRWMLSRVAACVKDVNENMEKFHISNVTSTLRNHLIHDLCDIYIELSKQQMKEPAVQQTLLATLSTYLVLLHPIMPYVTEDIHTSMHSSSIMNEKYPSYKGQWDVWYDPSSEEEFNSAVVEPTRAVRSIRKLAADVFGKESASASYVRMSVISAETTMVSHDTQNNHSQKDDTARSFSELLASNIEHVRQLSRHQNIEVAAGDGNDDDGDDDAPCLSRRLVMPNNASVVVRVYLPLLTGGGDENGNAIGDAHASINKELKLLRGRQKKVNKQLKKLKILTERSTYVQEAPPEIQLQHALKIAELEADTLDIDATMKILSDFESSSIL